MVLIVVADAAVERRLKTVRTQVEQKMRLFCDGVLPEAAAAQAIARSKHWDLDMTSLCGHVQNDAGVCGHTRSVFAAMDAALLHTPRQQVFVPITQLLQSSGDCPAARRRAAECVAFVAEAIDEACDDWGEWDLTKVPWFADDGSKDVKVCIRSVL